MLLLAWGSLRDAPAGDLSAAPVNLGSPLLLTLATGLFLAAPTVRPRYTWLLATAGVVAAAEFVIAERASRARIVPAGAWAARGPLGAALAVIALATVTFRLPDTAIYAAWVVAGLGMGVTIQTCNVVVLASARGLEGGSITAAGQLALNLGTVVGAALAGFVAPLGFGPGFAPDQAVTALTSEQIALLERGVSYTLLLAVAIGLGTFAIATRMSRTAGDALADPRAS